MPSKKLAELSALLEKTINNADLWPVYCDVLADFFQAKGTSLIPIDVSRRAFRTFYSHSLTAAMAEYVRDGWFDKDYRQRAVPILLERGHVFESDIVTPREMQVLPYYRDFLSKFGIGGFVGILLQTKNGQWAAAIQLSVGQPEPSAAQIALIPEIRRITEIAIAKAEISGVGQRFGWSESLRTTGHEAAIVDHKGGISSRSNGLQKLLRPFANVSQTFAFSDPKSQTAFDVALAACFDARPDALLPDPIFLRSGNASVLLNFSRFPSGQVHFFDTPEIVVQCRSVLGASVNLGETLIQRFGLTNAELDLLAELVRGTMVKDAAALLNITEGTARQRLKGIFRKTGTETQHQLVAMAYQMAGNTIDIPNTTQRPLRSAYEE